MPSGFKKITQCIKNGEFKYLLNYAKNMGLRGSLKQFSVYCREYFGRNEDIGLPSDKINIMFLPNGGLGDYIVIANYIYLFLKKYENLPLHVTLVSKMKFLGPTKAVFENDSEHLIDEICDYEQHKFYEQYDFVMDISRFPVIVHHNPDRLRSMGPELMEYVDLCEKFRNEHKKIIDERPFYDGDGTRLCIDNGISRMQQPDIYHFLEVSEEFHYPIQLPDKGQVLSKFGITGEYITVHRGCDTDYSKDSTKLWPSEYYQTVINQIKEKYPGLQIVQMGVSHSRCVSFENVDTNIIEKTSIDDLKILLKYAKLHLDCEGGMVHLRHAVHGGPSVVIFGPTSVEFYGYSENENISNNACPIWCEWASSTWIDKCVKGHAHPPCMYSTPPERVLESVIKILGEPERYE